MSMKNKFPTWRVIKTAFVGSLLVSRAFAHVVPSTPDHIGLVDDWRSLGDNINGRQAELVPLSDHIVDMIAAANLETDLAALVMSSYTMAQGAEIASLDAHWASILTEVGNAGLVAEFLDLRSNIGGLGSQFSGADDMVWLANHEGTNHGNGCDSNPNNGGGNGCEGDSPGQGSGANNDEPDCEAET